MACYGVNTDPIDKMSDALGGLEIDLMDAEPDQFATYARERREQLRMLVELYLDVIACFFEVMRAVATRTLLLERELARDRQVDRTYLEGFLPLYDRASERALRHLRQLLMEMFENAPELQAAFVAQMVASETVPEVRQYTSALRTADSPAQGQEHGKSGSEITDSIKDFLKKYLNKLAEDKNVFRRGVKRVFHFNLTKDGIEQSLHVINEILGMVFHRSA
jgi:hypothetical protein